MEIPIEILSPPGMGSGPEQLYLLRERCKPAKRNDACARVSSALKKISKISDLDQILDVVLDECLQIVQCRSGAIHVLDEHAPDVQLKAAVGENAAALARMSQKFARDAASDTARKHGPVLIRSTAADASPDASGGPAQARGSVLCVPILTKSGLVGALCASDKAEGQRLGEHDLTALAPAVAQMALAIEGQYRSGQVHDLCQRLAEAREETKRLAATAVQMQAAPQSPVCDQPEDGADDAVLQTLIGAHGRMKEMRSMIVEAVAPTDMTVCITGESGTGKTLIAREIHAHSPRRDGPFIEVACGVLSDSLLESELFGHMRGAFTGAVDDQVGKFELAHGGTIFLDEITTASAAMQVKLLRVLQERQIERIGGRESIPVDVRVIVAANTDLADEVANGNFRHDLYYRVNVLPIEVPPLRERPEDVPMLVHHFMATYTEQHGIRVKGITQGAILKLQRNNWPGNVRELQNVIERAVVLARGEHITEQTLAFLAVPGHDAEAEADEDDADTGRMSLKAALVGPEKAIILRTLQANDWNRNKTAQILNINRTTLYNKMRKYGLLVA